MLYVCSECFILMVVYNECSMSCCCYVRNALFSMCVWSASLSWLYAMNGLCLVVVLSGMFYTLCVLRMLHLMVACNECSMSCCCYVRKALYFMCVRNASLSWLCAMNALCLVVVMIGMLCTLCVSGMLHSHGCKQ